MENELRDALCELYYEVLNLIEDGTLDMECLEHPSMVKAKAALVNSQEV